MPSALLDGLTLIEGGGRRSWMSSLPYTTTNKNRGHVLDGAFARCISRLRLAGWDLLQTADLYWRRADAVYRRALALAPNDNAVQFDFGIQLATFGDVDGRSSLRGRRLDRARSSRDAGINQLLCDPSLLRYKDDPLFAAFCRKVGLPVAGEVSAVKFS